MSENSALPAIPRDCHVAMLSHYFFLFEGSGPILRHDVDILRIHPTLQFSPNWPKSSMQLPLSIAVSEQVGCFNGLLLPPYLAMMNMGVPKTGVPWHQWFVIIFPMHFETSL